jgi:hypothetical protein
MKPVETSASSSFSANSEFVFEIAEEQRRALEKTKQVERDTQETVEQQKWTIEAALRGN